MLPRPAVPLNPLRLGAFLLTTLLLASALVSAPAHAVELMDLRVEGLMMGADSIRKALELTPNQQTLWQQNTAKAWGILRTRQSRRDKLQADLKARLGSGTPDLRDLAPAVDAEAAASALEDQQLRELALGVNDALSDKQRGQVIELLQSQLDRLDAEPERGARPGGREGAREGGQHGGGRKPGGMGAGGGMGGMGGMGAGAGGSGTGSVSGGIGF